MKIHNVFHVSLLQPDYPNTLEPRSPPEIPAPDIEPNGEVCAVVDESLDPRKVKDKFHAFVNYAGHPPMGLSQRYSVTRSDADPMAH